MAGQPGRSKTEPTKRGTARPHFLRRKRVLVGVLIFLILAGSVVSAFFALRAMNQTAFEEGNDALQKADYTAAYNKLKQVDAQGGTAERDSNKSYEYFADLARAAWGAGDKQQAKRYAEQGLAHIPPEDTEAYVQAQPVIGTLAEIRDGIYIDPQDRLQPAAKQAPRSGDVPE